MQKSTDSTEFPWIGLIPFIFYFVTYQYTTTPNNVLYQKGLQEVAALTIPIAVVAASVLACVGFAHLKQLHGWRKITTLILSILHTLVVVAVVFVIVFIIVQIFSGKI